MQQSRESDKSATPIPPLAAVRLWRWLVGLWPGGGAGQTPAPWLANYPKGVAWDVAIGPAPLPEILRNAAATFGSQPCLHHYGKVYSYAEVWELVRRAARGLQGLGVGRGDRVGLLLPNSPYYVIFYYGVLLAGGTVVNFNPLYARREIASQIADSETRILVTINLKGVYPKAAAGFDAGLKYLVVCPMGETLPLANKALFALFRRREVVTIPNDTRHITYGTLMDNDGVPADIPIAAEKDVAVLQYTGGKVGRPMGAKLTHANLYVNAHQTRMWATDTTPGAEKVLAVLPLCHVFGMTVVMNTSLALGSEIILVPQFKVGDVLKTIHKQRPTIMMGVPTMYAALNAYKELDRYDLTSLRFCTSGGAALSAGIKAQFEELTGCRLVEGYGLTEAGPVCTINPFDGSDRSGSIGLPLPATQIRIGSVKRPGRVLKIGETGEICISGPQVMVGYWRRDQESDDVFGPLGLRTGDLGYMDTNGFVYIVGRCKPLIITGGFNVYPGVVEDALRLHPAVADVVVTGKPDRHRGEVVMATVALHPSTQATPSELRGFLRDKLATFELPRRIKIVADVDDTSASMAMAEVAS